MGRIFCPRCGNASLDKVRVVVGPDGAEQYGVRKKHVLRGTRFSLPKPKVGGYIARAGRRGGAGWVRLCGLLARRVPCLTRFGQEGAVLPIAAGWVCGTRRACCYERMPLQPGARFTARTRPVAGLQGKGLRPSCHTPTRHHATRTHTSHPSLRPLDAGRARARRDPARGPAAGQGAPAAQEEGGAGGAGPLCARVHRRDLAHLPGKTEESGGVEWGGVARGFRDWGWVGGACSGGATNTTSACWRLRIQ